MNALHLLWILPMVAIAEAAIIKWLMDNKWR